MQEDTNQVIINYYYL